MRIIVAEYPLQINRQLDIAIFEEFIPIILLERAPGCNLISRGSLEHAGSGSKSVFDKNRVFP